MLFTYLIFVYAGSSLCWIFHRWQIFFQSRNKETGSTLYSSLGSDEQSNFLLSQQVFIAQLSCFSSDITRLDVKLLNSIAG